jgi:trimeric autotransporter adhesin
MKKTHKLASGAVVHQRNRSACRAAGLGRRASLTTSVLGFIALLASPMDSASAAQLFVNDGADGECANLRDGNNAGTNAFSEIVVNSVCGVNSVAALAGQSVGSLVLNGNGAFLLGNLNISGALDVNDNQIHRVAAGTESTDAINLSQLRAAGSSVANALGGGAISNPDGTLTMPTYNVQSGAQHTVSDALNALDMGVNRRVAYDQNDGGMPNYNSITLGNDLSSGPVALHGVAPGGVSAASSDAINGAQLFATNQNIGANTTNISALDGRTTVNEGNVSDLLIGHAGLVQQVDPNATVTIAASSGGNVIGISGTNGDRRITGVAVGTQDNDAVNLGQLNDLVGQIGDANVLAVRYDDNSKTSVTLGGSGAAPVVLHNVADGDVSEGSNDAINGSQLHATNQQVSTNTGHITDLLIGRAGLVQQADANAPVTVAAASGGTLVTVNGSDGARQIRGVAAGTQDDDAVNLGQLSDLAGHVGDLDTLSVKYDDATRNAITLGGSGTARVAIHNVADGSSAYDAVNFGQLTDLQNHLQTQIGGLDTRVTVLENGNYGSPYLDGKGGSGSNNQANAGDTAGVALGYNTVATGDNASVVGHNAQALGAYGLSLGNDAYAAGDYDTAIGGNAKVNGDNSVAVGANSSVAPGANNAVAVGVGSNVNAVSGTAMGQGATVTSAAANAVAIGAGSVADRANTVSVGAAGAERQITNVAAGTQPTDAVNVGQLQNLQDWTGSKIDDLQQLINRNQRQANRGIASSAALVNNMPYVPGKVALSAGVANYRGENALGVALSRWSSDGRVNLNAGVSVAQGDSPIFRLGVGVVLGD